jgi:hypothetical protein
LQNRQTTKNNSNKIQLDIVCCDEINRNTIGMLFVNRKIDKFDRKQYDSRAGGVTIFFFFVALENYKIKTTHIAAHLQNV